MPVMSAIERRFCRGAPWRVLARRAVLPWALGGEALSGDVLELGGGSGAMAEGVARLFPTVRLTVTDLDPAMVASARRLLAAYPRVTVEQADATDLPFPAKSFDVATSYLMLHHVIDWRSALAEVARVVRPGGSFMGYDATDSAIARAVHRADRSPFRLLSADDLRDGLARAGFSEVRVETSARSHVMRFHARRPHSAR